MDPMEGLVDEVTVLTREFLSKITEEWRIMYNFDNNLKAKYAMNVLSHLKAFYADIIKGECDKKESMITDIEECLKEHSKLQQDLQLKIERHTRDDDPLQVILQTLNNDLKEYREMRDERLRQLEDLRKTESELCELLGAEALKISSALPSLNDLYELDQHIYNLRKTKIDRTDLLNISRQRLTEMMHRLELVPSTAFEKDVCEGNSSAFRLTEQNMKKLQEAVDKYEVLITEATERVTYLESKLEKLWERIRLPNDERIAFNEKYFGIGGSAVIALTEEIERCEILKRANMKSVIEQVRKEITHLWDLMTYSSESRLEFNAFFTDNYNEDVLELHEMEQTRLQRFYEKYQDLFSMADKRDHLLAKMEAFAASAKDPNRYKNRGGQLLREEKERKATEAQLVKIETQMKTALPDFELENGRPFIWRGEDLLATISAGKITKPHPNRPHHQVQKTPRAKENRPAIKRKMGHADETFTISSLSELSGTRGCGKLSYEACTHPRHTNTRLTCASPKDTKDPSTIYINNFIVT